MAKGLTRIAIPDEVIMDKIYLVRGQKIMLDSDLAALYDVETKVFNQSVKRNINRFPHDFMFELTDEEFENLRSQFVTSSHGGRRYAPKAFTEQGVAMLSSILNSERAIDVNISIVRIFTRLREMVLTHKDILLKLEQLEYTLGENSENIDLIFSTLKQMLPDANPPRQRIGFKVKEGDS